MPGSSTASATPISRTTGTSRHTRSRFSGGAVEVTKTTSGKFFDGKENNRYSESESETLYGSDAINFIAQRPYYFQQVRPDLF